eukprot:9275873-Alexandrium_andersonii.AAC.1
MDLALLGGAWQRWLERHAFCRLRKSLRSFARSFAGAERTHASAWRISSGTLRLLARNWPSVWKGTVRALLAMARSRWGMDVSWISVRLTA